MTINAGESAVFETREAETDATSETDADEQAARFDVYYSCLRCGTEVSSTEISRLPEIKCICGFKVFTKVRPPVVKSVRAI